MYLLIHTLLQIVAYVSSGEIRTKFFTVTSGRKLHISPIVSLNCTQFGCSKSWCSKKCLENGGCGSAAVNKNTGVCDLYDVCGPDGGANYVPHEDWSYIQFDNKDEVYWDDWLLMFRVQKETNTSAYDTLMDDVTYPSQPPCFKKPETGCVSMDTSLPCGSHYKSKLVAEWNTLNIQLVKVLVLQDSLVRRVLLFDGVGSNKTSWFSPGSYINSSWSDLTGNGFTGNHFSIKGVGPRHFHINQAYNGCPYDLNWLTLVERYQGNDFVPCHWDTPVSTPVIRYSSLSVVGHTDWLTNFAEGDALAILVKIED